jgi:hypothetical protein
MNLLIEYYKSQNDQRDSEYLFCIKQNLVNNLIKKIFVFISDDSPFELQDNKIEIIKKENRPTFGDLFDFCNERLPNELCIIANTDIFFDESLNQVIDFNFENIFIALTRWDMIYYQDRWNLRFYDFPWRNPNDEITTGHFSQDAWIFRTPFKNDPRLNFLMGKPGCDNRISQIVHENGYEVRNPSKTIMIKHLHQSNFRTYTNNDTVTGPYLLIKPTDDLNKISEIKTIPHF